MGDLVDRIRNHKNSICGPLHIGYANWDVLLERIERQEQMMSPDFADEQVWTFLVACLYAIGGTDGTSELARMLIECQQKRDTKAWFEVLPLPPRQREGNTHLDLAFGSIALRRGTQSGIELCKDQQGWISFVECKWYSDVSSSVSYDMHRNQLARVIENAIYFNNNYRFADEVHVTLVTPEAFRLAYSRLYGYKYDEYSGGKADVLLHDLESSCLALQPQLPKLRERVESANLHLHWVTYETLFKNVPDSDLKSPFLDFAARFNGTKTIIP